MHVVVAYPCSDTGIATGDLIQQRRAVDVETYVQHRLSVWSYGAGTSSSFNNRG